MDEEPECDPGQKIRRQRSDTEPVEDDQYHRAQAGPYQGLPGDLRRVEERDDEHGADIVHDRERRQEDLESGWRARRHHGQRPEREGDVGGHGHRPAALGDAAAARHQVDQHRDDHAADRRRDRQRRLARGRELSREGLPFDLEADQQEEDRHQPVVDPLMNRQRQLVAGRADRDGRRPEAVVRVRPTGIGGHHGGAGTGEEQQSAGGLGLENCWKKPAEEPTMRS